jgi:inhibitor of cysteine peptidase
MRLLPTLHFPLVASLALALALALLAMVAAGKTTLCDESDNNTHVILYVGDTLSIRLKSNVTTGYSWNTAELPSTLQELDSKSERGRSGRVGEAGFQFFTFRATAPGQSTLKLNYFRPFEKDSPPAKTFRLSLSIEPRPGLPSH